MAAHLARLGGAGLGPARPLVFGFGTAAGRDEAVERVRRHHGWTCIEPLELRVCGADDARLATP